MSQAKFLREEEKIEIEKETRKAVKRMLLPILGFFGMLDVAGLFIIWQGAKSVAESTAKGAAEQAVISQKALIEDIANRAKEQSKQIEEVVGQIAIYKNTLAAIQKSTDGMNGDIEVKTKRLAELEDAISSFEKTEPGKVASIVNAIEKAPSVDSILEALEKLNKQQTQLNAELKATKQAVDEIAQDKSSQKTGSKAWMEFLKHAPQKMPRPF